MKKQLLVLLVLAMLLPVFGATAYAAPAVGDTVTYGRYEQDNDPGNGPEPIEWTVLDVQDGRALLLSRYALDAKPYHEAKEDDTWESYGVVYWDSCSLRAWLNGEFLETAFSSEEQAAILTTEVDNGEGQSADGWPARAGADTEDRIFLLSYHEALELYFPDIEARRRAPTAYAEANGAYASDVFQADGRDTGFWWLRSPVNGEDYRAGAITNVGAPAGIPPWALAQDVGVCPALWLQLEEGAAPAADAAPAAEIPSIVGEWAQIDGEKAYLFNADGTGIGQITADDPMGPIIYEQTETMLTITYGWVSPVERQYEYTLEGDTLQLVDPSGASESYAPMTEDWLP